MKVKLLSTICLVAAASIFTGCGDEYASETNATKKSKIEYVTIGTGGITGVYYPTGGAISRLVNKKKDVYNLKASVESTGGSVVNINSIMAGDMEFGVVQSDRQYQAYNGLAEWKEKAQTDLRAVFSIHAESVTLVVAVDAGINSVQDLKGKRVNIGNIGSGQRQNAIDCLTAIGLDYEKDIIAESLKAAEAPKMLQDDRIDAFFYTVGHPAGAIKEATAGKRKVKILSLVDKGIDALLAKVPYYAKSIISNEIYPNAMNTAPINTFGVKATFCTSSKVSEDVVYAITKEVFENHADFVKLHPAYQGLTKADMLSGLSAPLHPGALKYFKEAGLK